MEPDSNAPEPAVEPRRDYDTSPTVSEASKSASSKSAWHPAQRIAFRFLCLYFALYVFPFPLSSLPGTGVVTRPIYAAWNAVVPWVGANVLGIEGEISTRPTGSGDRTYNYVQLLIVWAAAGAGCVAWTLLDRRRAHYRDLAKWLVVACRYYLAVILLSYGFAKIFKTQFPYPGFERLLKPYGDSSPMGLVWTFMGYSLPYNLFTGGGEVLGGLLLFFRRTTTLGALVTIGVMGNVVMLNFSYDVPVKLYSLHLLLLAVALASLDARRLANVFLRNRDAPAADLPRHFADRRLRVASRVVKALFIGWVLYQNVDTSLEVQKKWGDKRPRSPLHGLYEVTRFVRDGVERPPLVTDRARWRHFVVEREGMASVQFMDGGFEYYRFELDEDTLEAEVQAARQSERFQPDAGETAEQVDYRWTFARPADGVLTLDGEIYGSRLWVEMKARDPGEFLLVRRGFRWVNEQPFNR